MTKNEFLTKLKERLDENNLNDSEIIKKYERFFNMGEAAGMTIEEIIASIGTPDEIVNKLARSKKPNDKTLFYNLEIEGAFCENISFHKTQTEKLLINIDKELQPYLDFSQNENTIVIKTVKKFIGGNTLGGIRIEYGDNIHFGNLKLSTISGDIEVCDNLSFDNLQVQTVSGYISVEPSETSGKGKIKLHSVSGDISLENANVDEISISTVSGNFSINRLYTKNAYFQTTSGDGTVNYIRCDYAKISTISGDMKFRGLIKERKTSSVSGEINYYETK